MVQPNYRFSGPVLLFDGSCGFCAASVQFVLRHDRAGTLRFAPLESDFGRHAALRHAALADSDSVVWIDASQRPPRVYTESAAVLEIFKYLGGWWWLLSLGRLIPGPLRDRAYRLFAKHRHQFTRGGPRCFVPTAEQRLRFLS